MAVPPSMTDLQLIDHEGGEVPLAELDGTPVLFVLLPGAFTPVCTAELPGIQQLWQRAGALAVPTLTLSCDAPPVLAAWREAERLDLPLLSDFWPHGAVCRALDAFDEVSGRSTRTAVLLDAERRVRARVDAEAGRPRDLDQLAAALKDL